MQHRLRLNHGRNAATVGSDGREFDQVRNGMIALAVLIGWLLGGAANWMADVLPHWRPEQSMSQLFQLNGFPHYWTLWWRPWRGAACPHCGQTRPWRAPLLEFVMIGLFVSSGYW